jgi:hypothetical protein
MSYHNRCVISSFVIEIASALDKASITSSRPVTRSSACNHTGYKILLVDAHTIDDQIAAIFKVVVQHTQRHVAFGGDVAQAGVAKPNPCNAVIALSAIWRFFSSRLADLRSATYP